MHWNFSPSFCRPIINFYAILVKKNFQEFLSHYLVVVTGVQDQKLLFLCNFCIGYVILAGDHVAACDVSNSCCKEGHDNP